MQKLLTVFAKSSILDVWQGSEYDSLSRVFCYVFSVEVLQRCFTKKLLRKSQQNLHENICDGGPLLIKLQFSALNLKQRTTLNKGPDCSCLLVNFCEMFLSNRFMYYVEAAALYFHKFRINTKTSKFLLLNVHIIDPNTREKWKIFKKFYEHFTNR